MENPFRLAWLLIEENWFIKYDNRIYTCPEINTIKRTKKYLLHGFYNKYYKTHNIIELTKPQNIDYLLSNGDYTHIQYLYYHKQYPWNKINIIPGEKWKEYAQNIDQINK